MSGLESSKASLARQDMQMIHWNMNPVIFSVGPLAIHWYGLLFAVGLILGYMILRGIYDSEGRPRSEIEPLLLYIPAGAIVGARLGHCLLYEPGYYLSNPVEIFKIWEGGLASHGGAVGVLAAVFLHTRRHKSQSFLWLLDRLVIPVALCGLFIRIGNFFNSEIIGIPTNGSWGVIFERIDMVPRHPVQLYEAFSIGLIFLFLLFFYKRHQPYLHDGMLAGIFLMTLFSARFVFEFVKMPQAEYEAELLISVGQLLSIPFFIGGVVLTFLAMHRGRTPGSRDQS